MSTTYLLFIPSSIIFVISNTKASVGLFPFPKGTNILCPTSNSFSRNSGISYVNKLSVYMLLFLTITFAYFNLYLYLLSKI